MSCFLRNAGEILNAAIAASGEDCDLALLVDAGGGIRVVDGPGRYAAGLASGGMSAAYRVRRRGTRVVVEGTSGPDRCRLESHGPGPGSPGAVLRVLSAPAAYRVQLALPG